VLFGFAEVIGTDATLGPQLPVIEIAAQVPVNGVAAPPFTLAVTSDDAIVGPLFVKAVVEVKYS